MQEKIINIVDDFYKKYKTYNPFILADLLDIEIIYVPFLAKPYGQSIIMEGKPVILIHQKLKYSNERYFVCAHELFHSTEHTELANYYTSTNFSKGKLEMPANIFGAILLIKEYEATFKEKPDDFNAMYNEFGVPKQMDEFLDFDMIFKSEKTMNRAELSKRVINELNLGMDTHLVLDDTDYSEQEYIEIRDFLENLFLKYEKKGTK